MAKGLDSIASHPNKIIFLTCDAFGILTISEETLSNLTMYHFMMVTQLKLQVPERFN